MLERTWPTRGPELKGKLHVFTGDRYLLPRGRRQAALKEESLTKLGSDAVVEIIPDRDHSTLLNPELAQRLDREMNAAVNGLLPIKLST